MTFDEWVNVTFGENFANNEPITYFRMSAAWGNAQKENTEDIAAWIESQRNDMPATGSEFAAVIRAR